MSQACRKLVACDKVLPCKSALMGSLMADNARKCFILPKSGAKSFGIGIQDTCKVSVSNFGAIRWLLRLKIIQKQEFVRVRADSNFE